ncbi:MAG: glycosyltransferase [Bdellovibrionales bacterium]|nr:glycosyltransferase [Bdellovibrionales bacterium]
MSHETDPSVALVIPAKNAERTLEQCLRSVLPWQESGMLSEVILVDDGSTDDTADIARRLGAQVLSAHGKGRGAARNLGWRHAASDLVWFIDSDCVAEPDALERLLALFRDSAVAGAGGSYGIAEEETLLARLIHEEIVERHLRMPLRVNFLGSFNVMYRRSVLEQVGGFNEELLLAQDAELAYRVRKHGGALAFDIRSKVKHYHPTALLPYLRKQAGQGYWRVQLYHLHPERAGGDSYSTWSDHVQPPMAMASIGMLPFLCIDGMEWLPLLAVLLTALLQLPMTLALVRRLDCTYLSYAGLGFLRAYARGFGLSLGTLTLLNARRGKVAWMPSAQ